jgi:hypothetical protein
LADSVHRRINKILYRINNVHNRDFCRSFFQVAPDQENKGKAEGSENHLVRKRSADEKFSVIRKHSGGFPTKRVRQGGDHEKNEENEEENLGDTHRSTRDARESEQACDQRKNEKGDCPVKHEREGLFWHWYRKNPAKILHR